MTGRRTPTDTGEVTRFPRRSSALVLKPAALFASSNKSRIAGALMGEEDRRRRTTPITANRSRRTKTAHPASHPTLIKGRQGNGEAVFEPITGGDACVAGTGAPAEVSLGEVVSVTETVEGSGATASANMGSVCVSVTPSFKAGLLSGPSSAETSESVSLRAGGSAGSFPTTDATGGICGAASW